MTITVNSKKKQVKKSFQELINDLMTSSSEKVRYNAARVLGEMGDSKAVEPLIDVLKNDKNGSVRLYAARALGELGDSKATEHLIESLREDRNVDVRVRAYRVFFIVRRQRYGAFRATRLQFGIPGLIMYICKTKPEPYGNQYRPIL